MNRRNILSNVAYGFIAQGVSFGISIVQSLLVPKMLGLDQYAYWQLFAFYTSYIGFFNFGLNDGVYLLNGGKTRESIDGRSIKSQMILSLIIESFLGILLIVSAWYLFDNDRAFVITCTSLYMVLLNATNYLMFVLQALNETKQSSISSIINKAFYFLPLICCLFFRIESYKPLLVACLFSTTLQLVYCCWHCRDILGAKCNGFKQAVSDSLGSMRVGIKLMIANIAGTLIIGVLRMAIDISWGIESFGKLSFSLTLVNFFLAFVSQAAMVLFPALRQSSESEMRSFNMQARNAMGLVLPLAYLVYYPMILIVGWWLPTYAESLHFLIWLLPICVFESKMNITCTTIFKVRRQEGLLLRINVITATVSSTLICICVFILNSIELAIGSATIAITVRSLVSEAIISRELDMSTGNMTHWEVLLSCAFVVLFQVAHPIVAALAYGVIYSVFLLMHTKEIAEVSRAIRG